MDKSWEYINRSQTMDVKIRTEAAQFPGKEYINGIFLAVCVCGECCFIGARSNNQFDQKIGGRIGKGGIRGKGIKGGEI